MGAYVGDFRTGKVVRKMFNTNAIAGESITIATNGTVQVYKDGGTTQSTTGVTFTEDFDSLTGVHLVAVDTSADGTFYSAGSDFAVVLAGATVDGKAINAELFSFSIENRSPLMPTTDGRKLTVESDGMGHADVKEWLAGTVATPTVTGVPEVDLTHLLGTAMATPTNGGVPEVDVTHVNGAAASGTGTIDANVTSVAAAAAATIADKLIGRNVAGGSDTGRTVKQALAFLRNKWTASAGLLTVYDTDDATSLWTATISGDTNAQPVVGVDPS